MWEWKELFIYLLFALTDLLHLSKALLLLQSPNGICWTNRIHLKILYFCFKDFSKFSNFVPLTQIEIF
jgi:hypothetical protein